MNIDDMLRRMAAGAELKTQLDSGVTTYWFRSRHPVDIFQDESVAPEDAMALIESGYVVQNELETDCEGVWFTGYKINDAGRERVSQAIEVLERAPSVQPDAGDEIQDPRLSKM